MRDAMGVPLFLGLLAILLPAGIAWAKPSADLREILVSADKPAKERVAAGVELAVKDPDTLARAYDDLITAKREGDAGIIATIAVRSKVPHVRLLGVWAASKFKGQAGPAFLDKIDNDHPQETIYACEALGFLEYPDAYDRLTELLRNPNDLIALAAAEALARIGTKKQAKSLAETCLNIDNSLVRLHLVWAVQDMMGSTRSAAGLFGGFQRQRGTVGYRAKEAMNVLKDELAPVQKYKVSLATVRKYFTRRKGIQMPPVQGSPDYVKPVKEILEGMAKKAPAYYHLICSAVKRIVIRGDQWIFEFKSATVNLRLLDFVKWKDRKTNELRHEVVEYYLVRYATIMFYQQMGGPSERQRAWEQGFREDWHYAMDYTTLAVDEDPLKYLKAAIRKHPW